MLVVLAALALAGAAARTSDAAIFTWREGTVLHLANDAAAVPAGTRAEEYAARATARPAAAPGAEVMTPAAETRVDPAPAIAAPVATGPPIIIAPTIVVRGAPAPIVVATGPSWPTWGFLPSGFIGHEHPQVGFLAGARLVPHSHFFARGRAGRFTPYGHFSTHGVLVDFLPY